MEVRLGVGDEYWRTLTFKVWAQGDEVYAICREISLEKGSFHKSGITRFAENKSTPRPPIHSSRLRPLSNHQYCTVGRIIITTENNLGPPRDHVGKKSTALRHFDGLDASVIAIGFTSCHPKDGVGIDYGDKNIAVKQIEAEKFVTITLDETNLGSVLGALMTHRYRPMFDSKIIMSRRSNPADGNLEDRLLYFRSCLQTYTLWAHCNVSKVDEPIFANAIAKALKTTRNMDYYQRAVFHA